MVDYKELRLKFDSDGFFICKRIFDTNFINKIIKKFIQLKKLLNILITKTI